MQRKKHKKKELFKGIKGEKLCQVQWKSQVKQEKQW